LAIVANCPLFFGSCGNSLTELVDLNFPPSAMRIVSG
jgi:hypothetical protein